MKQNLILKISSLISRYWMIYSFSNFQAYVRPDIVVCSFVCQWLKSQKNPRKIMSEWKRRAGRFSSPFSNFQQFSIFTFFVHIAKSRYTITYYTISMDTAKSLSQKVSRRISRWQEINCIIIYYKWLLSYRQEEKNVFHLNVVFRWHWHVINYVCYGRLTQILKGEERLL